MVKAYGLTVTYENKKFEEAYADYEHLYKSMQEIVHKLKLNTKDANFVLDSFTSNVKNVCNEVQQRYSFSIIINNKNMGISVFDISKNYR